MGKVLLFYKYITIQKPEEIRAWQRELCDSLDLTGRIFIAAEGVNGTVAGSEQATHDYVLAMRAHPLFADVDFKESFGDRSAFPRMQVTIKPRIVNGGDFDTADLAHTGVHLEPEQVHALLSDKPENLVILDARNNYESRVGTFEGSILPNTDNFRELPGYINDHLQDFKDKQVLMFCTGGVRCEKATAYLKEKGVAQEVYQIKGGIHRYAEKYPNGFFKGKNYVFDNRVTLKVTDDVLTHCDLCPAASDDYYNCLNALCNEQFVACLSCKNRLATACSQACLDAVKEGIVAPRPDAPAELFTQQTQ